MELNEQEMWVTARWGTFDIPGYQVSTNGQVRKNLPGGEWEAVEASEGYDGALWARLEQGTRETWLPVAALVCEAFLGVVGRTWAIGYRDGNPANCCLDNLRPCHLPTMTEEAKTLFGVTQEHWKFQPDKVRAIRAAHREGLTVAAIARQHEVSPGTVSKIIKGETYACIPDAPDAAPSPEPVAPLPKPPAPPRKKRETFNLYDIGCLRRPA